MPDKWMEYLRSWLDKYKYILVACLCGLALVCIPGGETTEEHREDEMELSADVSRLEARLEAALTGMDGVGKVTVVLTAKSSSQAVYAYDEDSTIRQSEEERSADTVRSMAFSGSGSGQEPICLQVLEPEYRGALVICQGAGSATVRLQITQALSALTGLGSDKIVVSKMK